VRVAYLDTRLNISPSTVVDRFFLAPVSRSVGVAVEMGSDHVVR